jgi:hypothetical protein
MEADSRAIDVENAAQSLQAAFKRRTRRSTWLVRLVWAPTTYGDSAR